MSKASVQVDKLQSDSDLSLQLSDASSLSSDSDLPEAKGRRNIKKSANKPKAKPKKKRKAAKKDTHKYCICRKGYDGKEFMIECEDCKEWFHGACVGLKPNSVSYHYACSSCSSKRKPVSAGKTSIPPPPPSKNKKAVVVLSVAARPPPTPPQPTPVNTKPSIQDDEDEELDDICVLCDGDCTCNIQDVTAASNLPTPPPPPPPTSPPQQKQQPIQNKIQTKIYIPVPKKSSKAIPSKKAKKYNAWTVRSKNDDSDDDSDISISDSQDSHSDDDAVVERIGLDTKKTKSKVPKKRTVPKKCTPPVRRGKSKTVMAHVSHQRAAPFSSTKKGMGKKMAVKYPASDEEEASEVEGSDEELIVDDFDDLDGLLETMSPLSEHSSNESDNSLLVSEEFFTDDDESDEYQSGSDINVGSSPYASSIHFDSGDDEDIENVETQKIINELTLDSEEEEEEAAAAAADDVDSDILDDQGGMFVEDEYDELDQEDEEDMRHIYYARNNSHWSSSSEEEEEEEFDYTTAAPSEEDIASMYSVDDDKTNPLFSLLDSQGNIDNTIAAAFMQALVHVGDNNSSDTHGDITTSANTPVIGEDYQLSAFELTSALSALSAETSLQHNDILQRRPSLPSSAVSAARRMRGSQDFSTSEALRALSALASDDLSLVLEPIDEVENKQQEEPPTPSALDEESPISLPTQLALSLSNDPKLQDQILEILQGVGSTRIAEESAEPSKQEKLQSKSNTPPITHNHNNTSTTSPSIAKPIYSSRQILPKPSGSGSSLSAISVSTSTLEQQIQEALIQNLTNSNKRKAVHGLESDKKRRSSRSNSLGSSANQRHLQSMAASSFSTPASPASPAAIVSELEDMNIDNSLDDQEAAVSMDDLVDTSQLYTRSSSKSPSPEIEDTYSRDLSRWQRIPIGAFRLMRSKNKLWLER